MPRSPSARPARRPSTRARRLRRAAVPAAVAVLGAVPFAAEAQEALPLLTVQAYAGAVLPADGFLDAATGWEGEGGEDLSLGIRFQLTRGRLFNPYAGFSRHRVSCEDPECAGGREVRATAFEAGTRLFLLGRRPWIPWLRAGFVRSSVEVERAGGGGERGDAWGWEAGIGLDVRLSDRLLLSPQGRWVRSEVGLPSGELDLRLWVVGAGLQLAF